MSVGHNTPCGRCGLLWEAGELDGRGQCPICDGQLAAKLGLKLVHPREQPKAVELPDLGGITG
jgi:hypothetical protein